MRIQIKPNKAGGFSVWVDGKKSSDHKTIALAMVKVYKLKKWGNK